MDYSMDRSHLDGGSTNSTVAAPSDDGLAAAMTEDPSPMSSAASNGRAPASTRSLFLDVLTHAMQTAADQERTRIAQIVSEDAALNIEHARVRGAAESDELRRLAGEDIDGIQAWLAASIAELQVEATRRTDERRALLDDYLLRHEAIIDAEVASVDGAVNDYEATLDTFFHDLHEATKPSEIASKADLLPTPPDLDAARAAARASAVQAFADREAEATAGAEPTTETEPSPTVAGAIDAEGSVVEAIDGDVDPASEIGSTADVAPAVELEATAELEPGVDPAEVGEDAAPQPAAALVGVMDPSLPAAPAGPPDILHSVEPDPDAAEPSTEEDAEEPNAALRLVRSIFSRTDDV